MHTAARGESPSLMLEALLVLRAMEEAAVARDAAPMLGVELREPVGDCDLERGAAAQPAPLFERYAEEIHSSGTKFSLRRSMVERLHLPADGIRVRRECRFIEVRLGPRLRVEMAVFVGAAHQHR
jgi:hypothetical protein